MVSLTVEEIRKKFFYDAETGELTWGYGHAGITFNKQVGTVKPSGHRVVMYKGKYYVVARLCWIQHYGEWPEGHVKFRDGDKGNHAIKNLYDGRVKTPKVRRKGGHKTCEASGVSWDNTAEGWRSQITLCQRQFTLGVYKVADDAARVRRAAMVMKHKLTHNKKLTNRERVAQFKIDVIELRERHKPASTRPMRRVNGLRLKHALEEKRKAERAAMAERALYGDKPEPTRLDKTRISRRRTMIRKRAEMAEAALNRTDIDVIPVAPVIDELFAPKQSLQDMIDNWDEL